MMVLLMIALLCVILCAAVVVSSRGLRGGSNVQVADLLDRVDQLERSALAVTNELRRLEDAQRFTERLLTSRASESSPGDPRQLGE